MRTQSTPTYLVTRGNEIKLRLAAASVDADGSVHVKGCYVIDGEQAKADGCFDTVVSAAKAHRWAANRTVTGCKVGDLSISREEQDATHDRRMAVAGDLDRQADQISS